MGILGDSLAWGVRHYIGVGLSTVLFAALIAVGLSLLMDFQWEDVAERVGRFICRCILDPVSQLFRPKRSEEVFVRQDEPEVDARAGIVPIVQTGVGPRLLSPTSSCRPLVPRVRARL